MDIGMALTSGIGIVVIIFLFVLAVLWFLMPFAVFRIRGLAQSQLAEQKTTNKLLSELNSKLDAAEKARQGYPQKAVD
jgi:Na+-transporting methylmalonyl-CoA/oxaloacetate decarboxylase gamma subunit